MSFEKLLMGTVHSFLVDDFFEDPVAIRREILSIKPFVRDQESNYAGYTAKLTEGLRNEIVQRVQQLIGQPVKPSIDPDQDLFARLARRGDEKLSKSLIHCDPYRFTAIVYLSPPECIPQGIGYGTRIYERKSDGLNTNHYEWIKQSMRGQWTSEEFEKVVSECRSNSKNLLYWRMLHYIPFRFNLLSIFEGHRFHSSTPVYFGESNHSGRLTLNFFFELSSEQGKG